MRYRPVGDMLKTRPVGDKSVTRPAGDMFIKPDTPNASRTVHLKGGASNLPLKLTLGAQGEEGRPKQRQLGSTASVTVRLTGLGIPWRP